MADTGEITKLYSANFKRDYVAYLAIGLFFLILALEVTVAIGVPMLLRGENIWGEQVARQRMLEEFDRLRGSARIRNAGGQVTGEASIILNSLDILSIYLRQNSDKLSAAQIEAVRGEMAELQKIVNRLRSGKAYGDTASIDNSEFIRRSTSSIRECTARIGGKTQGNEK